MALNTDSKQLIGDVLDRLSQLNTATSLDSLTIEQYRQNLTLFKAYAEDVCLSPICGTLPHPDAAIPYQIYHPKPGAILPAVIFAHGGGYVANAECHHGPCARLAELSGRAVISLDYRLGPEHPYPAGRDDVCHMIEAVLDQAAQFQVNPEGLVLAGFSSGGGLMALAAHQLQHRITGLPQILISPSLDLTFSCTDFRDMEIQDLFMSRPQKEYTRSHYLPDSVDPGSPLVSAYWQDDLSHCGPILLIIAEHDGMRSDTEAYYLKLKAAGVEVNLEHCDGQIHSYFMSRGRIRQGRDPVDIAAAHLSRL